MIRIKMIEIIHSQPNLADTPDKIRVIKELAFMQRKTGARRKSFKE
jgi:hypothetical protein